LGNADKCRVLTNEGFYQETWGLSGYIRDRKQWVKDAFSFAEKIASCFMELHQTGRVHGCLYPGHVVVPLDGDCVFPTGFRPFHSERHLPGTNFIGCGSFRIY